MSGPDGSRRRVLLVTTHFHPVLGGVESHARDVASGLRERGSQVLVLTTRHDKQAGKKVERLGAVPVIRTPPAIGRRRGTKWLFVPVAMVAMVRLRRHYDVVFVPDLRGLGLAAVIAGGLVGRPVVIQGATPGAYSQRHWDAALATWPVRPPRWFVDTARRVVFSVHRRAQSAVCITREHQQEAIASGIAPDRVHYIPHGVDTQRFCPATFDDRRLLRARLGWPPGPVVLFLGRLSREKGILDLLEAWGAMRRGDAKLVIVGPDMTGHELDAGDSARAMVAARQLGSSVVFTGPTADPVPYLQAADILVQPSHYEAFPITVIEAMACGLAVAASFVGGLRDYLIDGTNGMTFPPQAPEALAAALERLLEDPDLRQRLSAAGRSTALAHFARTANLDAYERLFDAVARGHSTRRHHG